ncbi:hypothetical protein BaRGS_00001038 [Batillaria attramentaria]|uniref:Suppressor of cytokine signaling 7 n=1 Tax=Batillaria attramentaria TaxID=370345 RepID=A0ABD0M8D4_9CAEN
MGREQRQQTLVSLSASPPRFYHDDDYPHPHLHRLYFHRSPSQKSSVCRSVCGSWSGEASNVSGCRTSSRRVVKVDLNKNVTNLKPVKTPSCSTTEKGIAASAKLHQDFLESMKQLKDCGWYWGPLSYEEAESKLCDKRDGSFLVRDSSNENYILSLSFKSLGQVHHTRIEHHKGLFSFWSQPDSHGKAQICQFIEQTVENSRNGRFLYFLRPPGPGSPPMPIQLLYPVSRFCRVPSLQHMCRFLVLRLVRRDHIDHLPLPQKVKSYLLEKQYYVETLEED